MTWITNLLFGLFLQAPAQLPAPVPVERVIVGLTDGQQVVIENPEFTGFIQGHSAEAILTYRRQNIHGQMSTRTISRIDFGRYQRERPFSLIVTLKDGQKVELEAERDNFLTLKGKTDLGTVLIKHPDPVSAPVRLSTKKPDRKNNLTIQYLEFTSP